MLIINGENFTDNVTHNNVTVVDGDVTPISCHVYGGYPAAENISIECAGIPANNGKFIFRSFMNVDNCTCKADHTSGCYELITRVVLDVAGKMLLKTVWYLTFYILSTGIFKT